TGTVSGGTGISAFGATFCMRGATGTEAAGTAGMIAAGSAEAATGFSGPKGAPARGLERWARAKGLKRKLSSKRSTKQPSHAEKNVTKTRITRATKGKALGAAAITTVYSLRRDFRRDLCSGTSCRPASHR